MKKRYLIVALAFAFFASLSSSRAAVSQNAATFQGSGYLRSAYITAQYFKDAAFTYELWFEADSAGALINEVHQFNVSLWDYIFLSVDSQRHVVASVPGVSAITGPTVEFGSWHHAAVRYNPATTDLDLFLDGTKVGNSKGTRQLPWNSSSTTFMAIGRGAAGIPSFRGKVDEVRMWGVVLSDADIAANRGIKLANPDSRLFSMWSCDGIQGTAEGYQTTPDRSGNNNPALIVGSVGFTTSGAVLADDPRPTAVTGTVQDTADPSTILNGTATAPLASTAYFIWGEGSLTNRTPEVSIPAGASALPVQSTIYNLVGGKTYQYALVVTNEAGVSTGTTLNFTKLGPKAATFTGTGYLRSAYNTAQFFKDAAFTFELWFKADAAGALFNEVHQYSEPLWDYNFLALDAQGHLIASVPGVSVITGPSVDFGTWHHTAIRYNPVTQDLDLFLDGGKVGNSKGIRQLPWDVSYTTFMTVGRGASGKPSLRGQVDEVRMWGTALSDGEIAANRGIRLPNPDGRLFAMWSLDVIEGTSEGYPTSPDRSGNNNPAMLVGSVTLSDSGATLTGDKRPVTTTGNVTFGADSFTLNGTVTSTVSALAFFKYGQNGALDQTSSTTTIGAGTNTAITATIQGLASQGTYSYVLVASNEFGLNEGLVKTFIPPSLPQIVKQPASLTVSETRSATLSIQAGGFGTLSYQWRHEGTNLPAATAASYVIASATTNFAGNYDVVVSNEVGSTNSTVATVTVVAADQQPPVVTIASPIAGPQPSEKFTLEGTVTDDQEIASVIWEFNGAAKGTLVLTNGHFGVPNLTMVLHATNSIRVIAADGFANKTTNEALFYWVPPRSFVLGTPASVQEGARVSIPVSLISTGGVGGATFAINWNTNYLADPVFEWSDGLSSAFTAVNLETPKRYRASFALPATEIPSGTNLLATVSFRTRSVPSITSTPVTIDLIDVDSSNGDQYTSGNDYLSTSANITVRKIKGDNNANNRLDVGDASVIMRLVARLDIPRAWDTTANDLNNSASLDSGDAIKVLRAVVGIDPQPTVPSQMKAQDGDGSNSNISIAFDKQMVKAGDKVTAEVRIANQTKPISGASFRLEYPVDALRLDNSTANQVGPMVPTSGALTAWNVAPNVTDYSTQNGAVSLGVSSATAWSTNNGTLARFTFTVQANAAGHYTWPLVVKNLEVSHDGFNTELLGGASLNYVARTPNPATFGASVAFGPTGAARLTLQGDLGATYIVQGSSDLATWKTIGTYSTTTSGDIAIEDPDAIGATARFYKATLVQ